MTKQIITVETRLQNNSELVNYLNISVATYEQVKRKIWQIMTNSKFKETFSKESEFTKWCRSQFNLHSRIINSIIHEVKGLMNSYMELKQLELTNIIQKIEILTNRVNKDIEFIEKWKPFVAKNDVTNKELFNYIKRKKRLYQRQRKLNKLNQRKLNLNYIIKNKIYKICFGSKKEFKKQYNLIANNYKTHIKWHNDFIKCRDKNIYFVGAVNETLGNQMIGLNYDKITNTFILKVRRIEKLNINYTDDKYIKYYNLIIPYRKEDLLEILNNFNLKNPNVCPLTYRFHKESNKWYLQIIFSKDIDYVNYQTRKQYGVIGLDYNNGFIQLAETDTSGNLINLIKYTLKYHGTGNKAKTEIEQTISSIMKYAISKGKDVAVENLNFKKTKAKQIKSNNTNGKKYNKNVTRI